MIYQEINFPFSRSEITRKFSSVLPMAVFWRLWNGDRKAIKGLLNLATSEMAVTQHVIHSTYILANILEI